ncbi:cation:proton antiporter [Synechococcus sp. CS-1331]|uniref:cation:proton antiporter n=1 Tax=Synechococcus sp. CS-1331 TaxID=2847973 RepID=UPI00223A9C5E|nr:cation:proton antiporter [Synechococcus sp. CS-1331]
MISSWLSDNPLAVLALLLGVSVVVPPLVRRLGMPDLVGLLVAGVLIGPHGLQWLNPSQPTVQLLSDGGVIYLLFLAGLEIDLAEFARIRQRSLRFGLLTFALPMLGGLLLGLGFGYSLLSAVLIGSILSSHTPLGYPIVRSYGAMREEAVTVAIGGTIVTDIAALVVLALCMGLAQGNLSALGVGWLLLRVGIYAALVVLVITRLGRSLVQRSVNNDSQLFVAVLLAVFLAALAAELAGVEKIVGAFLAGLAVNAVLPEGRVREQVIVVGASLFIPVFFIDLGLMLDLPVFARTMVGSPFALLLIATLIGTKGLAAWWAGRFYGYGRAQILTMWSLSLPQVAATLAATFVGFRGGLLDAQVLNGVLALMVVTASLGPWLTARAIPLLPRLLVGPEPNGQGTLERRGLAVLVPITNPAWERGLIELAGLLANGKGAVPGRLMPLKVVTPEQSGAGRQWLQRSGSAALGQPLLRVDSDIASGIAAAALEQDADLVVMGLEPAAGLGRWLFGDLVEATCRQVACPVVVARLHGDPASIRRLLVPIKHLTAAALEQFQLARRLAAACGARLTLLHLHDPNLPAAALGQLGEELQAWLGGAGPEPGPVQVEVEVMLKPSWAVENDLIAASSHHDLVILRCQRRVVAGLPIPASERVSRLLGRLECSTLVISDPLRS